MKPKKKKLSKTVQDILKAARKESREAEIKAHGKPIKQFSIEESPKKYKRSKQIDISEQEQ